MDIARFKKVPILGILRGIEDSCLEPLLETVIACGMQAIEITMNTPEAAGLIKKAVRIAAGRLMLGAGTVLTRADMQAALDAGAPFIVMPNFAPEIVAYCVERKIPVFPGALTPHEAWQCWSAGATMVKIFPASVFGPGYFKSLSGPFSDIALMAVGGVTDENIVDYFRCGAQAVAVGESVFNLEQMRAGDFSGIKRKLGGLIEAVKTIS